MCAPKKQGDSYDKRDAWNQAALKAGLETGVTFLDFFKNRGKVSRKNQNTIDEHNDDIFKWQTKYNNDVIAFFSEGQDADFEAETLWLQANKKIAKNQLASWNAMANASNAAVESYANMMSIAGNTGPAGLRAGGTSRREAVLAHGMKMAKLGAELSGKLAESTLASEMELDNAKRRNHAKQVQHAAGRPIPGTKPTLHDSELIDQDSAGYLALGIGSNLMDAAKTFRDLKPKNAKA